MDKFERRGISFQPVDIDRLNRLCRQLFPGQGRTHSLAVRGALIAMERGLEDGTVDKDEILNQMEQERGKDREE